MTTLKKVYKDKENMLCPQRAEPQEKEYIKYEVQY